MMPKTICHLPPSTPSVPPSVVCIEAATGAEGTFSPLSGLSDPPGEKVKSESLALLPNPAGESNINPLFNKIL